jgi:uncharacterized protein (DUF1810 family)
MDDPYLLERFVAAQDAGGTYERALAELRLGRKASHWMWFVFPQIAGLGKLRSSMTLFARAAPDDALFRTVFDRYFDGRPDPATERRL